MVRSALLQHAQGTYQQSAALVDSMFEVAPIAAHANIRSAAFSSRSGLPLIIEPSEGVDDRRAKALANRVDEIFWDCCPENELKALHIDGFMLSRGVGRVEIVVKNGEWLPRLRRLRPHGLSWSESERLWFYIDGAGRRHPVTPGENGWLLFEPFGCDGHTRGAVSSLGIPFIMWMFARRDAARYSEKFGLPGLAVEEPFVATDDIEGMAKLQATYEQLMKLGQEAIIRLPQGPPGSDGEPTKGWAVKWHELSGGAGADVFFKLLGQLEQQFAASILGRDSKAGEKLGGDGAQFASKVLTEYLQQDVAAMADALREQVWFPYTVHNVDRSKPELAPYPRWDARPPVDLQAKASALGAFADAATKLTALGVDLAKQFEEFGLKKPAAVKKPSEPSSPEPADKPEPQEPEDQ